jgi:hypothetical protein
MVRLRLQGIIRRGLGYAQLRWFCEVGSNLEVPFRFTVVLLQRLESREKKCDGGTGQETHLPVQR